MKLTLTKKMIGYFLLVILVATAGFTYTIYLSSESEDKINALGNYDIPHLEIINEIAFNAMAKTANVRAYFIYGDERYLNEYKHAAELNAKLEEEMIGRARTEATRHLITEIKVLDDKYSEVADKKVIASIKRGNKEEAMRALVNELAPLAGELLAKIDEAKKSRKSSIGQAVAGTVTNAQQAKSAAIIAATLATIVGIAVAIFAARRITRPIKELQGLMAEASKGNLLVTAAVTTRDEIGQLCESFNTMIASELEIVRAVRNSAVELAAASQQMAASANEVSTASANISEEIQDVARSMVEASDSSTDTAQILVQLSSLIQIAKDKATSATNNSHITVETARGGKAVVTEVKQSMDTIYTKTIEAEKIITLLNKYSQQIGMINETITGIAKQTNLLALNAAIEAARAGEAGKGFAVVADEVRKLAEQSNTEAGSITQLINKIIENTDSAVVAMKHSLAEVEIGVQAVNKADMSLESILAAVAETVSDISGIVRVTEDEIASSDKIVQLIEVVAEDIERTERDAQQVSASTEETTATIETIAASSEQTSAMAQNLQNLISKFQV
ncbi:methyl-accepting chemotaxis protein [Sporomusa sp.]|uniref:methyl-accepting chemotaxis protein n=1 Tax=Sporomusa sp. TaxID=2078658 RepID=UPI002BF1A802|nr:methyl-accepting chemotaxis protein [Sporomusa sp.]HWR44185.1 methyl-accepting chemotaxis protein [Sporomusa sp.]